MSLRPTYEHPRAKEYRAPGGAWDVPSFDEQLTARADPTALAVVQGDVRLTGAELETRVGALAGALRKLGVRRRDVVAWQLPNWWETVVLYRACWRLGAVGAVVHHLAGPVEAEIMLDAVKPKVVLGAAGGVVAERPGSIAIRGDHDGFSALLDAKPVTESAARPSDIAVALFTSGSTGIPKAALHTQRALSYKAIVMTEAHALTAADSVLMPAPLAHISGMLNAVQIPGYVPMKSVLMERFDPELAIDLIEQERITFMIGPPTFFVKLMSAPGFSTERVETLRLVSSGGAGVTPAFVENASKRLGARVKRTYGSTEAPTVTTSVAADSDEQAREHDGRATGVAELRVSDPVTFQEMSKGETGELWLRGPELFAGYADAEATRAATHRGWFRTGDLATVDAEGWLTIVGRMKDVIIRGGENIAAAEVEGALEAHPDVRQAVAVGFPDAVMGERVCAYVVAEPTFDLEVCRAWFVERGVARFKTPERVVVLDEFPLLAAGKPDRAALRERAAE
jgi:cyclohexanecarboxylate-CoA ligase